MHPDSNLASESNIVDVLVVGAGLSGLRAALDVQKAGLSCIVLEATDRVGGKTLTVPSKPTGPGVNDIGGAWINDTTQSEMCRLLQKYNLQGEVQRTEGMSLLQLPEGTIAHPHDELPLKEEEQLQLLAAFAKIQELAASINLETLASDPGAKELDKVTVQEYCYQTFKSELVSGFIDSMSQSLMGVESSQLSMLCFVDTCRSGTGIDAMISDGKNGAQYLRVRQGAQSFSNNMAKELHPDSLYLSTPVNEIEQCPKTGNCTVRSSNNAEFQAKKVILSVPTTLYNHIRFNPPLPETKQLLAEENVMGYYSKIIFVFNQPWWHTAGLSGALQAQDGAITFSRDTSIPDDDQWSITCFVVGERGRQWSQLSQDERRQSAWTQFVSAFSSVDLPSKLEIPAPINIIEMEWSKQEFFLGAPCPVSPPGILTSVGMEAVQTPFGNIHFVGTETSVEWKGYMEGAVRSGDRGAKEVIEALKGQV